MATVGGDGQERAVKILISYAGAGAGHRIAAGALEEALRRILPAAELEVVDCLEQTNRFYRNVYAKGYLAMINHTPTLWGYVYHHTDRPKRVLGRRKGRALRAFDALNFLRHLGEIRRNPPDRIVATHFLLPELLRPRYEKGKMRVPIDVTVTDFDVHKFWVNPHVTRYFVGSPEVAWILERKGIPGERIVVAGIPIRPTFASLPGREDARARFGLDPHATTVLVMAGGFGVGRMHETSAAIMGMGRPVDVVSVAGRNEELRRALETLAVPDGCRLHVLGYVEDMASLMAACDIVITKSGGLTVAECLAAGLPMIVLAPVPGQEERNCDFLVEAGAAVKAPNLAVLEYKLRSLLDDPERLDRMRAAARRCARPRASFEIAEFVARSLGDDPAPRSGSDARV